MEQILHQINKDKIEKISYTGDPKLLDDQNEYWLELKNTSEQSAINELERYQVDPRILNQIEEPTPTNKINIYSNTIVMNLVVSKTTDIYADDILTLLVRPGLLVTILDSQNKLFDGFSEEINNNPYNLEIDIFYVIYYMITQILYQSTLSVKKSRQMVDKLSVQIDEDDDELELSDVLVVKRQINHLANIIEDQNITLGLIPKINWSDDVHKVASEIANVINRFGFLQDSVDRLEEKVRELQLYYQLILQEKSNKRLNTLTIIQSIFVPLTFIAGIYGMNFLIMPELKWTNGYYIVLGTMTIVAVSILWLFKRRGWFD